MSDYDSLEYPRNTILVQVRFKVELFFQPISCGSQYKN